MWLLFCLEASTERDEKMRERRKKKKEEEQNPNSAEVNKDRPRVRSLTRKADAGLQRAGRRRGRPLNGDEVFVAEEVACSFHDEFLWGDPLRR